MWLRRSLCGIVCSCSAICQEEGRVLARVGDQVLGGSVENGRLIEKLELNIGRGLGRWVVVVLLVLALLWIVL